MNLKTNKYTTVAMLFVFILLLFIPALETFALDEPLTSLFGEDEIKFEEGLGPLFNQIFRIGLTVAAVLAVIFIAIGGFQYMTTDAISGQTEGRNKIQNAVYGLLLALMIFIILNTINPDLLNLNPKIENAPQSKNAESNFLDKLLQGINTKGGSGLQTREQQIEDARKKIEASDNAVGSPVGTNGRLNSADRDSLERKIKRLEESVREDIQSDDAFEQANSVTTDAERQRDLINEINKELNLPPR